MENRNRKRKRKWRSQRPIQPLLLRLLMILSLLLLLSLMRTRERIKTQGPLIMGRSSWMQRARLRIFSIQRMLGCCMSLAVSWRG